MVQLQTPARTAAQPRAGQPGRDKVWDANLSSLAAFVAERGRLPNLRAGDAQERRLGIWLNNQREHHRKGALRPNRKASLDARLPGWDAGSSVSFLRYLACVESFVAQHGRLPAQSTKVPSENRLGQWLNRQSQRDRKGSLPTDLKALLDARLPGWGKGLGDRWEANLTRVAIFVDRHDRLPNQRGSDADERHLAVWLANQRRYERMGTLPPGRKALLNARLPCWEGRRRPRY